MYWVNCLLIIGVLQAINKLSANNSTDLFFNIEDEGVVKVLAQILTSILHNSLLHDDRDLFYQDLQKILKVDYQLSNHRELRSYMNAARDLMQKLFNVTYLRVFIINKSGDLVKFIVDTQCRFDVQAANFGIVSQALLKKYTMRVPCGQNHVEYNGTFFI